MDYWNCKIELYNTSSGKLEDVYYNPRSGYSGIDDLTRKGGSPFKTSITLNCQNMNLNFQQE